MQILYVVKDLSFANIGKMIEEISSHEIGLLGLCDRLGRQSMSEDKISEEYKNVQEFIKKCEQYLKENQSTFS